MLAERTRRQARVQRSLLLIVVRLEIVSRVFLLFDRHVHLGLVPSEKSERQLHALHFGGTDLGARTPHLLVVGGQLHLDGKIGTDERDFEIFDATDGNLVAVQRTLQDHVAVEFNGFDRRIACDEKEKDGLAVVLAARARLPRSSFT